LGKGDWRRRDPQNAMKISCFGCARDYIEHICFTWIHFIVCKRCFLHVDVFESCAFILVTKALLVCSREEEVSYQPVAFAALI
jgi:hypothetical protein